MLQILASPTWLSAIKPFGETVSLVILRFYEGKRLSEPPKPPSRRYSLGSSLVYRGPDGSKQQRAPTPKGTRRSKLPVEIVLPFVAPPPNTKMRLVDPRLSNFLNSSPLLKELCRFVSFGNPKTYSISDAARENEND